MEHLKRENKIKNKRYSILIIIGISFIFLGISYLIYNQSIHDRQNRVEENLIEEYFKDDEKEEETPQEEVKENKTIVQEKIDYIAVLEIPKINLKRGLVEKNNPYNNVNRNIYMLKETTMPDDQVNSHILLAGHSGNSYISYFRYLNKLDINDEVNLYYKNQKYSYKVVKKYEIEKTGKMQLNLTNTSDITLITCKHGTNKQLVFVAELSK